MQVEIWKDIKGYEGLFKISNYGRVISYIRAKEKVLKRYVSDKGYAKTVIIT